MLIKWPESQGGKNDDILGEIVSVWEEEFGGVMREEREDRPEEECEDLLLFQHFNGELQVLD